MEGVGPMGRCGEEAGGGRAGGGAGGSEERGSQR
jgi:hypothetical protein